MPRVSFNSVLTPRIPTQSSKSQNLQENSTQGITFSGILDDQISQTQELKFSKHAQARLESRNITLNSSEMQKLTDAVNTASKKGLQDSLVMMGSLAFIVSVPEKTVVTAMPVKETGENIFTNIDGAVVI